MPPSQSKGFKERMFYYTLLFMTSRASLFCLGAQVGRAWSSPYVLKVKLFPLIFQARSNLKQASDTAYIRGKAACPLREGSGPRARHESKLTFSFLTGCEQWFIPTCLPVSFLLTCSYLGLTWGSAQGQCGPHGDKPASGRPWESTAHDFKLTSEVRLSDMKR